MSNLIWKTDGLREASTKKLILYFAGGGRIPYTGWNHPDIMMLSASNESWWNYTDVMRWCYADDLIAQADKAERLQKAVDLAVDTLKKAETTRELTVKGHYVHAISLDELHSALVEIKQLIKGE